MPDTIIASAPGSLMITGEHAVLHGRRAIAAAVSARISVTLTPGTDSMVHLDSSIASVTMPCNALVMDPRLRFVCGALSLRSSRLGTGVRLAIRSEFPPDLGLGSSAAVTVASLAALDAFAGLPSDPERLQEDATRVVRSVQGCGSGADVAASVYGGMVLYRGEPRSITELKRCPPVTVIYSGSKLPTPEVIRRVDAFAAKHPRLVERLYDAMDEVTSEAWTAAEAEDWHGVGRMADAGQGLMESLGVCNERLASMVQWLRSRAGVSGAKISGSGLGDCVIGIGCAESPEWPYPHVPVTLSTEGVHVYSGGGAPRC